jgi:ankyrin repeat protein
MGGSAWHRAGGYGDDGLPLPTHRSARGPPPARSGTGRSHFLARRDLSAGARLGSGSVVRYDGTPLDGPTLLHRAVEFEELDLGCCLIQPGADVNARARIDGDGFGGHTPLFGAVVNNSYLCGRQRDASFARLLLDHGADPDARASIRKQLRFLPDETMHVYFDVTPISWGERFHGQRYRDWVNKPAMQLIADSGRTR